MESRTDSETQENSKLAGRRGWQGKQQRGRGDHEVEEIEGRERKNKKGEGSKWRKTSGDGAGL